MNSGIKGHKQDMSNARKQLTRVENSGRKLAKIKTITLSMLCMSLCGACFWARRKQKSLEILLLVLIKSFVWIALSLMLLPLFLLLLPTSLLLHHSVTDATTVAACCSYDIATG